MTPQQRFQAARFKACRRHPYLTDGLLAVKPVAAPGLGTMGVTAAWALMVDWEWVGSLPVEEVEAVLLHEVSHLLRRHHQRARAVAADPQLWNVAGDAEINDDGIAAGWKFPGSPVTPASIGARDGLTAEQYWQHLREHQRDDRPAPCCGSGAGNPLPNEPPDQVRSEQEGERVRAKVARAIQAAVAAKGAGAVPAGWGRWADVTLAAPRVPWQSRLARVVRAAVEYRRGGGDFGYDRPSRLQGAVGWGVGAPVLPAVRTPVPRIAVVVDTSGSMGQAELSAAVSEVRGILRAGRVTFMAMDAAVHGVREIRDVREVERLLVGGGGTDFGPAFAALDRRRPRPEVVVVLTDGDGSMPPQPPRGVRVVWALIGRHVRRPPWGEIVQVTC